MSGPMDIHIAAMCHKDDEISELESRNAELEAENQQLREQMRWIPVSERLPVCYENVLVTNESSIDTAHRFMQKGEAKWASLMNISYWKPILLPQEQKP
jgi:hypothetical protein